MHVQTLALVGSYVPRQCGIATFTKDLRDALISTNNVEVPVLAMDDSEDGYPYPKEVRFQIRANVLRDYQLATDFLNINEIDARSQEVDSANRLHVGDPLHQCIVQLKLGMSRFLQQRVFEELSKGCAFVVLLQMSITVALVCGSSRRDRRRVYRSRNR